MRLDIPRDFRVKVEMVSAIDAAAINNKLDEILMKQSELASGLREIREKLIEASHEINERLSELGSTDPDISPEGQELIQDLKAKAQSLADVANKVPALPSAPGPSEPAAPAEPAPAPPEGEQPPA